MIVTESVPGASRTPDRSAAGFLGSVPDPLRYNSFDTNPSEAPGLLRSYMPAGVRVLDVGCSTGSVTSVVNAGRGNIVVGIEPDPDRAAAARLGGLTVETRVFDEDFLSDQDPFDVVTFADVLEHLVDPAEALRLAFAILRPGGLVLASVPNVAHWTIRRQLLLGRFDYQDSGLMDSTHLRWFTESTLRALFERVGFDIVDVSQSAGTWLHAYSRFPFTLVPSGPRASIVKALNRRWPRLFGCQHVLMARKTA